MFILCTPTLLGPMVVFLLGALSKARCPYRIHQFECIPCPEGAVGGHFDFDTGKISICQDWIQSTTQVEDTLSHELIHAFDNCRVEQLNRKDCRQVACSEIRASNLSGECKWTREMLRGNLYPVASAHKACVRRRVKLSLEQNKAACQGCDIDKIIDEVWDPCYNDTAPFIEIP